jgi:hypothetical protein
MIRIQKLPERQISYLIRTSAMISAVNPRISQACHRHRSICADSEQQGCGTHDRFIELIKGSNLHTVVIH